MSVSRDIYLFGGYYGLVTYSRVLSAAKYLGF